MYIDRCLIDDFKKEYPDLDISVLKEIIESDGVWYSFDGIKYEHEDWDLTLEEVYDSYYFIIIDNNVRFVSPEELFRDIDLYISS